MLGVRENCIINDAKRNKKGRGTRSTLAPKNRKREGAIKEYKNPTNDAIATPRDPTRTLHKTKPNKREV